MSKFREVPVLSWMLVAGSLVLSSPAAIAKSHPYSAAFVSQAQSIFFEGRSVSTAKVDAYIARLKQKRDEVRSLHIGEEAMKGNRDPKKVAKKVDDEKVVEAFDLAIANLERMKTVKDEGVVFELAANALDIESAVRIEGEGFPVRAAIDGLKMYLKDWKIPRTSPASAEASNLYDPVKREYLSVSDVQRMKDAGADISLLGPGPISMFWENPGDVKKVDVSKAAIGKTLKLYDGIVEFPEDRVFYFDQVKHNDTKPKMDVYTVDSKGKKKSKFKLKWGAELHADPTNSALSLTLGFKVDVTKYARDVKVYIGKTALGEIKREWDVYYSRDAVRNAYPFEKYVKEIGKDEGGEFIVFKEALIEAKPKEIDRIGAWAYGDYGHSEHRELRGLSMVQLWLRNSDMKEFNNNRLLLKKEKDGTVHRHLIISDVGASLGSIFHEMADLLSWRMVKSQDEKEIVLNYRTFHPSSVINIMTLADARWGTRLIAALTREQIQAAVDYGNWPECIRPIVVEKLISRRNDLVQTLGLVGSRQIDGTLIALLPVNGPKSDYEIDARCDMDQVKEEFTSEFQFNLPKVLDIVGKQLRATGLTAARAGINSLRRFQFSGPQLGLSEHIVGDVIVDVDRIIERNPSPKSEEDIYIVKDRVEIGVRLGAVYGVYKDFLYTKSYTLVYPGRSVRESELRGDFVVNVLLPAKVELGMVPEKYVLMTEHYLESGSGVQIENPEWLISPVLIAGGARVRLFRSIFDHRDPAHYTMYRDRSSFSQGKLEALVRLFIFKLPVFRQLHKWGTAIGRGSTFTAEELNKADGKNMILKAVVDGDFTSIEPREKTFDLVNKFESTEGSWKFLFWGCDRSKELDQIELTSKDFTRSGLQYRTIKDCARNVLGNKEQKSVSVEAYTDEKKPGTYQLNVRVMSFDMFTQEKHLENRYIGFANGLSLDGSKVINFTPSLGYSTNKRWGTLITTSDTQYSETAMAKILAVTPQTFWASLAGAMGVSPSRLDQMRKSAAEFRRERGGTSIVRAQPEHFGLTADDVETFAEAEKFLKRIENARKEKELKHRVEKIAEAVRQSLFVNSTGFYSPRILGALNRIAGSGNVYSRNMITTPPFKEVNLIEEVALYGEVGAPLEIDNRYLVFKPVSGVDLYNIFDSWF